MKNLETNDPKEHARNIKGGLQELTAHIRRDISKVDNPKAKALFETSAEVIQGLTIAFTHYEEGNEEAWK